MKCLYTTLVHLILQLTYIEINGGEVTPISISECPGIERLQFLDYKKIEGKAEKGWTGNITFPFLIDSNTEFKYELRWWKNGDWEKNAHTFKGKACFYLQKFAGKLWKQIREAVKPPIQSDCPVPKGTYVMENFVADLKDVHLPMMGKGRFQGKVAIAKDGKTFCAILIAELS